MNNARYMSNISRGRSFEKKLSKLQIGDEFMNECENDYKKIIESFLEILKKSIKHNINKLNQVPKKITLPNVVVNNELNKVQKIKLPNVIVNNNTNKNKNLLKKSINNLPNVENATTSTKQINNTISHECAIYYYLQNLNQNFINTSTCFLGCDKNFFYSKNCGITFEQLILSNPDNFILFKKILEKLFETIHFLHLLGVAHNNLNCRDVLVGKRKTTKKIDVKLKNFSKATILQNNQEFNYELLEFYFSYYTNILEDLLHN